MDQPTKQLTKAQLHHLWKRLDLKASTLLHLQEVLDTRGIEAAMVITDMLQREKKRDEKPKVKKLTIEWGREGLRILSLQGARPYLLNLIRFIIEALLAWRFVTLPLPTLILFSLLLVVVGAGGYLFYRRHTRRTS